MNKDDKLNEFLDKNYINSGSYYGNRHPRANEEGCNKDILIVENYETYELVEKLMELSKKYDTPFLAYFKQFDDIFYEENVVYTECCETYIDNADYGTKEFYVNDNGEVTCFDCMKNDESMQADYIDFLLTHHNHCNIELTQEHFNSFGYQLLYNFEFTSGMYNSYKYIDKDTIESLLSEFDFFYSLNYVHPYETGYTVAIRKDCVKKAIKILKQDEQARKSHRKY